jgi:hypothetical protein
MTSHHKTSPSESSVSTGHGSLDFVVLQVVAAGWEKFGYEPNTKLPDGAQMIDGEWYIPKWGCDSLEASLNALQASLQNNALSNLHEI